MSRDIDSADRPPDRERWFDRGKRYRILETLGAGAFGVVYRVHDESWGQEVALKTIQDASPEVRQWLKAEYRVLRDIVHPNLVRLHDLHVDGDRCFFTMEIVGGGLPFNRGLDFDRSAAALDQGAAIRRICRAGSRLADALAAVHAFGKCHRDIKPSNILVGPADHLVLLDFGLAGAVERQRTLDTARDSVLGTLPYLAPEQYASPRALPASDWYSVGLVLYEALAGRLPFADDPAEEFRAKQHVPAPPSSHVAAVPEALDKLILSLLDPDPRRRPSAAEVMATLESVSDDRGARSMRRIPQIEPDRDFVAREEELSTLARALSAADGRLVTVDVVGPSGIGKTALIKHFLRGLPEATLVLEARCDPHESIPYKAFDAIVDDVTRYWVGLGDAAARELRPQEGVEALTLLFPELRRVPVLDTNTTDSPLKGDPRTLRQTGFRALQTVLAGLREKQPVLLWVDDVQWADADSIALLESIFGTEAPPPVVLILSRRPDAETLQPALLRAIALAEQSATSFRIDLAPLAEEAARRLARAITDRSGRAADSVASILEEARGVPYLVSELAYFATQRGARGDEAFTPTTAGSLMRERLAGLSSEDRAVIELAALSCAAQSPSVLLEAAGSRDRSRLRDLCVLRLLRRGGGESEVLQVYHDRLREFVVEALPPNVTQKHHLALVIAMEGAGDSDAEVMVEHALAAKDRARTRLHARTAAKRAETALAFEQAARMYGIALDSAEESSPRAELRQLLADALANAGHSTRAAPEFELAARALEQEAPHELERRGFLRRRAGEQYLKAGHYDDGLRLMEAFLTEANVTLPKTGNGALAVSALRRVRLYLRGFDCEPRAIEHIAPRVRSRLDDLWAATTALSMMDPVRADAVGLLHFVESLEAGHTRHVARSLGYEAAFAALIGGPFMRRKARDLLRRNREALAEDSAPYERAFYQLGAGSSAFFHSQWTEASTLCDAAADGFRKECRGAEYEAAVAVVFSLQALGQAGRVSELVARIPAAIREADGRGDLFATNNYRGGFHALGRIAAGQVKEVHADLRKVVETWKPGFYQMHAYHRVFAGVAADLYIGDPGSAVQRIEGDWPVLEAGLFLRMELPAMELRYARARAALALSFLEGGSKRRKLLRQTRELTRQITRSTAAASRPHAALLRAGLEVAEHRVDRAATALREALDGYSAAAMHMHTEVSRWTLGRLVGGREGNDLVARSEAWMRTEGVPEMPPLVSALAPGLDKVVRGV